MNLAEICDNAKKGREYALLGNYDSSMVYYQGVLQQIQRHCQAVRDPAVRGRWQQVRQELLEEYEQVKSIVSTLESFKIDKPPDFPVSCQDEPFRDPAVWPPPVPAEHRERPRSPPKRLMFVLPVSAHVFALCHLVGVAQAYQFRAVVMSHFSVSSRD
uniref:Katanin catalytic subunit A1 like 1 n=1 Tax=Rousettus aegyptiacus TaxID=9407 RepID=A0A7J8DWU6_ROUAE|nr:katanin catalytic subunit A1 like 1 [Rousettus aegyptiacus]